MAVDPPERSVLPASWAAGPAGAREHYAFRLYVAGTTPLSARAIVNIRRICEAHLVGRYTLEIVDISQHPERVAADQLVATPTLVRLKPLPAKRFIGDLSATRRVIEGLDIVVDPEPAP